jgi:hypothetical protein
MVFSLVFFKGMSLIAPEERNINSYWGKRGLTAPEERHNANIRQVKLVNK